MDNLAPLLDLKPGSEVAEMGARKRAVGRESRTYGCRLCHGDRSQSGSHIVQGLGCLFQVRELVTLLLDHRIRCAPVRSVEEVAFDPELDEREMLRDNEYPTLDVSRSRRHRSSGENKHPNSPRDEVGRCENYY